MANVLPLEKQIAAISALAEGVSIRSIERMTGIHRDTIMRLGVKIGEACAKLMDSTMRDLPCQKIEVDEIWGFIGKKQRNCRRKDSRKPLTLATSKDSSKPLALATSAIPVSW